MEGLTTSSDNQLVERFVRGNDGAFGELFSRHGVVLARRLRRIFGDGNETIAVLTRALREARRQLGSYDANWHFPTWLTRVALTVAEAQLKQPRRPWWTEASERTERHEPEKTVTAAVKTQLTRPQLFRRLYEGMEKLTPTERFAFAFVELEQVNKRDVGIVLDCPEEQVADLVAAARTKLHAHLQPWVNIFVLPDEYVQEAAEQSIEPPTRIVSMHAGLVEAPSGSQPRPTVKTGPAQAAAAAAAVAELNALDAASGFGAESESVDLPLAFPEDDISPKLDSAVRELASNEFEDLEDKA